MVVVLRGDAHLGGNHVALEVILAVLFISAAVFLREHGGNRMSLLGGGFQTNRAGLGALIALLAFGVPREPIGELRRDPVPILEVERPEGIIELLIPSVDGEGRGGFDGCGAVRDAHSVLQPVEDICGDFIGNT